VVRRRRTVLVGARHIGRCRDRRGADHRGAGGNLPSAIVLDGDLLYVTNRGADTIAVFERSPALRRIAEVPCAGRWPRDLVLDGTRLHVANQNSDSVVTFTAGPSPAPTGEVIHTGSPACVLV
jgi:6-phosphogluconolactonase